MDAQRLRNLTTGLLHTDIGHVYQDLEWITGQPGLMTHMLPRALDSILPWLHKHVRDERFWDDTYNPNHTGEFELPEPDAADRQMMKEIYFSLYNPLAGREVIAISI
jgi:hypothetical protein